MYMALVCVGCLLNGWGYEERWHDLQELQAVCQVDAPLLEWLSYTGSTTQRMRDVFGRDVSVVLLPESPFPGMVLSHFSSLGGRHVALYADARIWMLASSYFTPELPASQSVSYTHLTLPTIYSV